MILSCSNDYQYLFSPLPVNDFKKLKKSIALSGQWHPIITNADGVILDGHNRYKICEELKLEPKSEVMHFEDKHQEYLYVIDVNDHRRQLTPGERIAIQLLRKPALRELSKKNVGRRKEIRPNLAKLNVRDVLSTNANVSHGVFSQGEFILKNGTKKDVTDFKKGKRKISKIYNEIKRKDEISKIIKKQKSSKVTAGVKLFHGDFFDNKVKPESVDLVYTDPPYTKLAENSQLYNRLASHTFSALKPGGSLFLYIGGYNTYKIMTEFITAGFELYWINNIIYKDGTPYLRHKKIINRIRHVLWFVKNPIHRDTFVMDTQTVGGGDEGWDSQKYTNGDRMKSQ